MLVTPVVALGSLPAHTLVNFLIDLIWFAFTVAAALMVGAADRIFFCQALRGAAVRAVRRR